MLYRRGKKRLRAGQSLVESCVVLFLICLVFAGMFQLSRLLAAKELLQHAANRGARARTVGLNQWMVHKTVRVAAIPNGGKMLVPDFEPYDPVLRALVGLSTAGELWDRALTEEPEPSAQGEIERARIPFYLESVNHARSTFILDYADWDAIHMDELYDSGIYGDAGAQEVRVVLEQDYPLTVPLHGAFYSADTVPISAETTLENHYPLYMEGLREGW